VHANLRGSALLAGMALGRVSPEEVRSLVPVAAIYHPHPDSRELYRRHLAAFTDLYRAQRQMFKRLNRTAEPGHFVGHRGGLGGLAGPMGMGEICLRLAERLRRATGVDRNDVRRAQ